MALGDVTATFEGTFDITSAAFITEMDTLNTGAQTAGGDTKSIILVPAGNLMNQVHIVTIARAGL
jgi:hypothetical protein|tara:strand:- start:689 stop:883 length:195 start_codon:yes stop_codon:yes gene_type:complete